MKNTIPTHIKGSEPNLFEELANSARLLNNTMDTLGTTVAAIEQSLKAMNLGVTAHAESDGGWEHRNGDFERHVVTYAKGDSGWGLRILILTGNVFDVDSVTSESFRFDAAPREARAAATKALPELLRNLSIQAEAIANQIQADVPDTAQIATSLKEWQARKPSTESTA